MLKEKYMPRFEIDIDVKPSSIKNPCERLFEKEKKEGEIIEGSIVKEESLITPLTLINDQESSKGNYNILNSSFRSYFDTKPSYQKYQKHHYVLLLFILEK